jgi:hypothetical protein
MSKHLFGFLFCVMLFSCKNQQLLTREKLPHKSKHFLIEKLENNQFDYQKMTWKAEVDFNQNGKKSGFKINARLLKDSAIWMSISPALGIEVARMLLTKDSVKLINKYDKTYFAGTYDYLSKKYHQEITFELFQNVLAGKPLGYDPGTKFKIFTEIDRYLLQAKASKRLARISGVKKSDWISMDSLDIKENKERRLQKVIEKLPDEATLLTRYWLEPVNYRLVKQGVYDFENDKKIEIEFKNFATSVKYDLPNVILFHATGNNTFLSGEIMLSKIKTDRTFNLPFNIPEKYESME